MIEDAEAAWASADAVADLPGGICGCNAGSGGGRGGLGVPRRFPLDFGGSAAAETKGCSGGEYWVPASTVDLGVGETERGLLCGFGPTVGD